jgi:hypothetical protein
LCVFIKQIWYDHYVEKNLAFENSAGKVNAKELHRAILVLQVARFSTVMTTQEWIKNVGN